MRGDLRELERDRFAVDLGRIGVVPAQRHEVERRGAAGELLDDVRAVVDAAQVERGVAYVERDRPAALADHALHARLEDGEVAGHQRAFEHEGVIEVLREPHVAVLAHGDEAVGSVMHRVVERGLAVAAPDALGVDLAAAEDVEAHHDEREGPELYGAGHAAPDRLHLLRGADLAKARHAAAEDGGQGDEEREDAQEGAVVDGDAVVREGGAEDELGHETHDGGADARDDYLPELVAHDAERPGQREEHGGDQEGQEAVGQPAEERGGVLVVPVAHFVDDLSRVDEGAG